MTTGTEPGVLQRLRMTRLRVSTARVGVMQVLQTAGPVPLELTYCPIYRFKPSLICTKDLTRELFCPPRRGKVQAATGAGGS